MKNLTFKVEYFKDMINIDTGNNQSLSDFVYGNIFSTEGHGIQVNSEELEEPALKMCNKISKAVYEYIKETK